MATPGESSDLLAWEEIPLTYVLALPTLSALTTEGQANLTELVLGSCSREHFWKNVLLVFLARQGRHLQMGPSSDRESNAQTPVVPSVAQTWRKYGKLTWES